MRVIKNMTTSGNRGWLCATASHAALITALGVALVPAAYAQSDNTMETVVVSGVRASILSAVDIKRKSAEVVDSIVAEDIGKLQDSNVAETMSHIPGITGYRYGGEGASPVGVGSGVTIRGLSGLTASRVDGRSFYTAGQREFNIEEADPGMVAGIDVYKNPSAEHIEGAIGGLVNIRTHQPLDFKGLVISGAVTERYNDLTKSLTPSYTALLSNRWSMGDLGEMGFLIGASYDTSNNRSDNNPAGGGANLVNPVSSTDAVNYTAANGCNMAYFGVANTTCLVNVSFANLTQAQAIPEAQRANLVSIASVKTPVNQETILRERIGFTTAFQWQLSPSLEVYANSNYVHYLYNQKYRFMSISDTTTVQNLTTVPYTINSGVALRDSSNILMSGKRFASGTFIGDTATSLGGDEHHPYETMIVAGGAKWNPTDKLDVKFDLSFVSSEVKDDNRSVLMTSKAGLLWNVTRDMTSSPHGIQFSGPDLSDARNWVLNNYSDGTFNRTKDEGLAAQIDLAYATDLPFITKLKVGGRYSTQLEHSYNWAFTSAKSLTTDGAALAGNQSNGVSAATFANLIENAPSNWMHGDAGYSGGFAVFSPDALLGDNLRNNFALAGIPAMGSYPEQVASRRIAKEATYAGYVVAEFAAFDDLVSGNLGVRLVDAEDTFTAWIANVPGPGYSSYVSSVSRIDALPSANIVLHIRDDLQAKFGFGKNIARPDFGATNPSLSVSTTAGTGGAGNPNLKPTTSTSYDISLEYYPTETTAISVDFFDKEVKGFTSGIGSCETVPASIVSPYTGLTPNGCTVGSGQYFVTRTVNTAPGSARGVEFAAQTFFDFLPGIWSHFGVQGAWTYVDAIAPVSFATGGALYNLPLGLSSKNSYALSGLYDDGTLSARLAYTYRSDFAFSFSGNPIDSRTVHGYGLLDFSTSYNIGYNLNVTASVSNITNQGLNRYQGEPGQYGTNFERQHYDNGRIYGLGIRYRLGN